MPTSINPPQRGIPFQTAFLADIRHGIYSPGEKLPSERGLGVTYGFSRPTVHKNLEELAAQGIVEYRNRTAYVSANVMQLLEAESPVGRVVLLMNHDNYSNLIYASINKILMERLGTLFHIRLLVTQGEDPGILASIHPEDVVVVLGLFLARGLFKAISAKCRNIFAVNFKSRFGNWLLPDNYQAGRKMAEMLYGRGHRKIAVVLRSNDDAEFEERFRGAYDFLAEQDCDALRMLTSDRRDYKEVVQMHFDEFVCRHEATALLCLRHSMALQLYDLAREHGMVIPRDFSLVSFDDNYGSELLDPPLTSCRYPVVVIAEKLLTAIPKAFEMERGTKFLQETIAPLLVERDSVATLQG